MFTNVRYMTCSLWILFWHFFYYVAWFPQAPTYCISAQDTRSLHTWYGRDSATKLQDRRTNIWVMKASRVWGVICAHKETLPKLVMSILWHSTHLKSLFTKRQKLNGPITLCIVEADRLALWTDCWRGTWCSHQAPAFSVDRISPFLCKAHLK